MGVEAIGILAGPAIQSGHEFWRAVFLSGVFQIIGLVVGGLTAPGFRIMLAERRRRTIDIETFVKWTLMGASVGELAALTVPTWFSESIHWNHAITAALFLAVIGGAAAAIFLGRQEDSKKPARH